MRFGYVLALAILVSAACAFSQETGALNESRIEMDFGTAFMHVGGTPSLNAWGLDFGSQYHLTSWLGYNGQAWFAVGSRTSVHNYLFGPEVILRRKISPFAHVMIGIAHQSQSGRNDTALGAAVGGGVAVNVNRRISWRAFEINYAPTYFRGVRQDNIRFSSSFSIHF
jgi:hypothetical protein